MAADALPFSVVEHPDIREPRFPLKRLPPLVAPFFQIVADVYGDRAAAIDADVDRTGF